MPGSRGLSRPTAEQLAWIVRKDAGGHPGQLPMMNLLHLMLQPETTRISMEDVLHHPYLRSAKIALGSEEYAAVVQPLIDVRKAEKKASETMRILKRKRVI